MAAFLRSGRKGKNNPRPLRKNRVHCNLPSMIMSALLLVLLLALTGSNGNRAHQAAIPAGVDPAAFIFLQLQGYGADETTLALQKHDLSIAAFTNRSHHWHAFPGLAHLIPTSTPLPFGSSYGDLANVPGLPLGRKPMAQAVGVLAAYGPAAAADDAEPFKRALASLTVMACEGPRLKPISEALDSGWDSEARVAPEHLPLIHHWDTISYEIIRANRTGKWDGPFAKMLEKEANIRSLEEAVAVVNVLVYRDFGQVLEAHAVKVNIQDVDPDILTAVKSFRESMNF